MRSALQCPSLIFLLQTCSFVKGFHSSSVFPGCCQDPVRPSECQSTTSYQPRELVLCLDGRSAVYFLASREYDCVQPGGGVIKCEFWDAVQPLGLVQSALVMSPSRQSHMRSRVHLLHQVHTTRLEQAFSDISQHEGHPSGAAISHWYQDQLVRGPLSNAKDATIQVFSLKVPHTLLGSDRWNSKC
jgi:hypothetical protein